MPIYYYRAKDLRGETEEGDLQAPSQEAAASILQKRELFITLISDKPFIKKSKKDVKNEVSKKLKSEVVFFGRISTEDKMMFSVQLANMVSAGLPLIRALYIILQQTKNPKFHSILEMIYQAVESGVPFSEALQKYPKTFPVYFTSSVKAGEVSGQLDKVLENIASFTEHDMETKQSMQAALTYPMILIVVGTGIIFFVVTGVIPSFVSTFLRIGVEPPLPTLILYKLSIFLRRYWYILGAGIAGFIFLIRTLTKTPVGALIADRIKLSLPFAGTMIERFSLSRFARTFGMLLECGVPILLTFKIVKDNIGNAVYAAATDIVYKKVMEGAKVAEAMKAAKAFPLDLIQMVAVGEETGRLDDLSKRLGSYYDTTARYSLKKFMAMLEPLFLLILSVFIGFIMAAVLLPIFDMMKMLKQG